MDAKRIRSKLIGSEDERAVSPVIGVILMVAITVILAAVIAAFVLDLGQSQSASASAGVQFQESGGGSGQVQVTWIEEGRTDGSGLTIASGDCYETSSASTATTSLGSVGESVYCNTGTDISITATYEGSTTTIATWSN
jgi:flagellin-like protein